MALLLFKLNQLLTLLVPAVAIDVAGTFTFPDEIDFVQRRLLVRSNFVVLMIAPLRGDPLP
jgi:hypothetical protein